MPREQKNGELAVALSDGLRDDQLQGAGTQGERGKQHGLFLS